MIDISPITIGTIRLLVTIISLVRVISAATFRKVSIEEEASPQMYLFFDCIFHENLIHFYMLWWDNQ